MVPGRQRRPKERAMKDGLRLVDGDMHLTEPPDLLERPGARP